jgi:type I restriction enzyme M protein
VFYYRQEYGKALYAGYLIRFKFNPEKVMPLYVYEMLLSNTYKNWVTNTRGGSAQPNINAQQFASFKIPVPPIEGGVQQKLVEECLAINSEYHESIKSINEIKENMEQLMSMTQTQAHNLVRLDKNELFDITIGRRVLKSEIVKDGEYDVYSANVFEAFGKTNHSVLNDFSKPSVLWGIDGDWMVNYQEAEKPFNPTDHCGVIRVLDETVVNPRYLVYPLLKAGETERFSRSNRASTERVKTLSIMLPDIKTQNEVAQQLIDMEAEIVNLKSKMQDCITKKQDILDKYLK